jgi:tartrate-resistant acid phosphatase type 5
MRAGFRAAVLVPLCACTLAPLPLGPCPATLTTQACELAVRTESGLEAKPDEVVRFFAIGDAGVADASDPAMLGATTEYVAWLTDHVCARRGGCDFGVFLGDNVYEVGLASPEKQAFLERFAQRYSAEWTRPLYFVLGNHDYHPVVPSQARAEAELLWVEALGKAHHGMVRGRSHFFGFSAGPVDLFAWDTNHLVRGCEASPGGTPDCVAAGDDALRALQSSRAPFRIWLGHHPYWSNGEHGDAGDFEDGGFSLWRGAGYQQLMREHVVGRADLAISGHDHNLQAFEHKGTALLVSGAGAKSTALRPPSRRSPSLYQADQVLGLALIEASSKQLTVELYAAPAKTVDGKLVPPSKSDDVERLMKETLRFRMSRQIGQSWVVDDGVGE